VASAASRVRGFHRRTHRPHRSTPSTLPARARPGHGGLHVARASARRKRGFTHGPLQLRRGALGDGHGPASLLRKHNGGDLPRHTCRDASPPLQLNPGLPTELERIINRLLEKTRDLRYQSAADLRSELKRLKWPVNGYEFSSIAISSAASLLMSTATTSLTLASYQMPSMSPARAAEEKSEELTSGV
jgi:hypothetical protein